MGLVNKTYDVGNLAEITANGFTAAQFPQIRDALARKLMEIYGNDIDISSASADGQYVNMEALVMNNVYRVLESLAVNLDPSSASGKYLDIIAGFSNTRRILPTYSRVMLYVVNKTGSAATPDAIRAIDKNGHVWSWINPLDYAGSKIIELGVDEPVLLEFACNDLGAVQAFGTGVDPFDTNGAWNPQGHGDIYQGIDGSFEIYQRYDAVTGNDIENDASLRSRCIANFGQGGATVIDNLRSRLMNLHGVKDVYVFNNASLTSKAMKDGTSVSAHNVYIVIACEKDCVLTDYAIGSTIYNAMTPGVVAQDKGNTDKANGTSYTTGATPGSWKNGKLEIQTTSELSSIETVYWKACNDWKPKVEVTLRANSSDFVFTNEQKARIYEALRSYLENVKIDEPVTAVRVCAACDSADMRSTISNLSTFRAVSAKMSYYAGVSLIESTDVLENPLASIRYANISNWTLEKVIGSDFEWKLTAQAQAEA